MLLAQKAQLTNTFAQGLDQRKSLDYSPLCTSQANLSFSRRDQSDTIPGVQWKRSFGIANDSYDSSGLGSWFMDGWKKGLEMIFFRCCPCPFIQPLRVQYVSLNMVEYLSPKIGTDITVN